MPKNSDTRHNLGKKNPVLNWELKFYTWIVIEAYQFYLRLGEDGFPNLCTMQMYAHMRHATIYRMAPKTEPLPNYQKIVLKRIEARQCEQIYSSNLSMNQAL